MLTLALAVLAKSPYKLRCICVLPCRNIQHFKHNFPSCGEGTSGFSFGSFGAKTTASSGFGFGSAATTTTASSGFGSKSRYPCRLFAYLFVYCALPFVEWLTDAASLLKLEHLVATFHTDTSVYVWVSISNNIKIDTTAELKCNGMFLTDSFLFLFLALTAPSFGAATTTAAAPATGFNFGSTNTGKAHLY